MKKLFSLLLALVMVLSVMGFAVAEAGTFTGVGDGKNGAGTIEVEVDVDADGKVTDVRVTKNGDDAGISDPAVNQIPGLIVDLQSANIDIKTGATLTQGGIQMAVLDAIKKAGLDEAAFSELKAPAAEKSEDIDATYDVVVVGGGGAGLTASIRAAQAGAKVVLIEKTAALGGNTLIAGQGFNAADPERQQNMEMNESLRKELESYLDLKPEDFGDFGETLTTVQGQIREYLASGKTYLFDTPELHMLHCYMGGTRTGLDGTTISPDLALIDVFAHSADAALDWAESIGVQWGETTSTILGAMWPRSHGLVNGNIIPILENAARSEGVEILLNTKGNSFIVEDGKVVGVNAETSDGAAVTLHANSGVVLATGGFSANAPMVVEYNNYWPGLSDTMPSTNASGITGDGIVMAKEIGADLVGMGYAQLMPSSHPVDGSLFSGIWGSAETQVFVNKEGKRYVNEYAERDVLSKAALDQTDGIFYIICDAKIASDPARIASMEAAGNVVSADTLEELAQKLGLPVDDFIATIDRYNTFVENQVDEDFGKPLFGEKIDTAPFVATPRSPSLHHTMGGVKINTSAQVINTEGNVIEGLFAAGEVCGGIHAGNRLGGNAMTDFLVFGSIAGTNAAKGVAAEEAAAPAEGEVKTASAKGFASDVTVEATIADGKIVALTVDDSGESYTLAGIDRAASVDKLIENILAAGTVDGIDVKTGATFTSTAVVEALSSLFADAGEADAAMTFTPDAYTATAEGYNGPTTVEVTFSETKIEDIKIASTAETGHVGDVAFDIMIPEMLEANGSGVDGVSGATFSSRALRNAVTDAAEQAGCTNLAAFKAAKVEHTAQEPMSLEYDVVVVGAGGAGISAAAQAAQDGNTVLVIEKNAEIGGNTLVSGGQYQSVMPYLVWDPADPDATTGVYEFNGETYDKVKSVQGCINELKMILNWSEEPFDEDYYKDHEFVAGDALELSKHGVHVEYLPTLQALKAEIREYFVWAAPQLAAGKSESQLPLFSTLNLHIFQTYYGGLRQTADKSAWIYGDVDLVKQFILGGQGLKEWLEAQGSAFVENTQPTLIGALWYRENEYAGANIDTDGDGETEFYADRWGSYFMAPLSTILKSNEANKIMTRTTANELIVENGRVVGVKAARYDGTEVTVAAKKGVILATGGYAANIPMVLENNVYWSTEYLTSSTKTTNRSSLQGDGIALAQSAGAATTGLGFTQLMPISWVDNGNLAFGGGNYACWINPTTGKRFVDEGSERDVLSLAEFRNGMTVNGTPGVFLEIYNATERIPGPPSAQLKAEDYEGRYYHVKGTVEAFTELFAKPEMSGVTIDAATVLATVKAYDKAVMGQGEYPDVGKAIASRCIGNVQKDENGNYLPDTYDLEGADLIVRLMAPSTHHTMGGLVVDVNRHVLNTEGEIIPGLYAAGEVTGGIHGGNRLGGNAIVEIFVSGRTAAQAVTEDNK